MEFQRCLSLLHEKTFPGEVEKDKSKRENKKFEVRFPEPQGYVIIGCWHEEVNKQCILLCTDSFVMWYVML